MQIINSYHILDHMPSSMYLEVSGYLLKMEILLGMVVHVYNPSIWEAEAGEL
jgi:hypothetical protein